MLRELLSLFKTDDAIALMGENFARMLDRSRELTLVAGSHFFEGPPSPEERTEILRGDTKVNKLERKIRKQVIAHLTLGEGGSQVPYCLLLMSLVKDVERIGDYAKNIVEIFDEGGGPLPEDGNVDEIKELRRIVESIFAEVSEVFISSDYEKAAELIQQGREVTRRSDHLLGRIAKSPYDAATTTTMVLATRYYKRIAAHLLNVLSGIVMPLHKLDYYDEDYVDQLVETHGGSDEDE